MIKASPKSRGEVWREVLYLIQPTYLTSLTINLSPCIPEVLSFHHSSDESEEIVNFPIKIDDAYYLNPDGSKTEIRGVIENFFQEIFQASNFNNAVVKHISFSGGTYLKIRNSQVEAQVKDLVIKGILRTNEETVEIKEDYIWLIMKSIFEKKMFLVYPDGIMREVAYE